MNGQQQQITNGTLFRVVVAPQKTGICGSDMHVFLSESVSLSIVLTISVPYLESDHTKDQHTDSIHQAGKDASKKPIVLGHESAGFVTKVGSQVTTLQVGDRVAMEVRCGQMLSKIATMPF